MPPRVLPRPPSRVERRSSRSPSCSTQSNNVSARSFHQIVSQQPTGLFILATHTCRRILYFTHVHTVCTAALLSSVLCCAYVPVSRRNDTAGIARMYDTNILQMIRLQVQAHTVSTIIMCLLHGCRCNLAWFGEGQEVACLPGMHTVGACVSLFAMHRRPEEAIPHILHSSRHMP